MDVIKDYIYIKDLADGRCGMVKQYENKNTKQMVAIKKIGRPREVENLNLLKSLEGGLHRNILEMCGSFTLAEQPHIITELVPGEDLQQFLYKRGTEPIPRYLAIHIFYEMVETVQYIHKNDIVHGDIKPENIMIWMDGKVPRIKFVDWEMSFRESDKSTWVKGGSIHTSAPEVLDMVLGTFNDIWSLGVCYYALITNQLPFSGDTEEETIDNIKKIRIPYDTEFLLEEDKILLEDILVPYKHRATASQILDCFEEYSSEI